MDLLVSYARGHYGRARREIARILARQGDCQPRIETSGIPGICIVRTALDNRDAVAACAELWRSDPAAFRFTLKWLPVDYWCDKDFEAMEGLLRERVAPRIAAHETWAMQVQRRGWAACHTAQIVQRLAEAVDRKVRLKAPDWRVRIDVLGAAAAVSVLRPGEVFSARASGAGERAHAV